MPVNPANIENPISVDPLHDGVVFLSPKVVLFKDAQPRPDGRKIYHIFEHALDDDFLEEDFPFKHSKEFNDMKTQLFSKASENSIENIQVVLEKNGILFDEWCPPITHKSEDLNGFPVLYGDGLGAKTEQKRSCIKHGNSHSEVSDRKAQKEEGTIQVGLRDKNSSSRLPKRIPNQDRRKKKRVKINVHPFIMSNDSKKHLTAKKAKGRILPIIRYRCASCHFSTVYKNNLKAHEYIHSDIKKFQCVECDFQTNYKSRLWSHERSSHAENANDQKRLAKCREEPKTVRKSSNKVSPLDEKVGKKAVKCQNEQIINENKHLRILLTKCSLESLSLWVKKENLKNDHKTRNFRHSRNDNAKRLEVSNNVYLKFGNKSSEKSKVETKLRSIQTRNCHLFKSERKIDSSTKKKHNSIKKMCRFANFINSTSIKSRRFPRRCKVVALKGIISLGSRSNKSFSDKAKNPPVNESLASQMSRCVNDTRVSKKRKSISKSKLNKNRKSSAHFKNKDKSGQKAKRQTVPKTKGKLSMAGQERVPDRRQFKCSKCAFCTKARSQLERHELKHIKSKTIKCTKCTFVTHFPSRLKHHQKLTHGQVWPKALSTATVLVSTKQDSSISSRLALFRCPRPRCDFSYDTKLKLKFHLETGHVRPWKPKRYSESWRASDKNSPVFECQKCYYKFTTHHLWKQHQVAHLVTKSLKCEHCEYETNYKGNLLRHVLIHVDQYLDGSSFASH